MAYLMTHFWPGGTEEQYRSMQAAVHPPDGLPAGQIHHAGGPTEGGYLITRPPVQRAPLADREILEEVLNGLRAKFG